MINPWQMWGTLFPWHAQDPLGPHQATAKMAWETFTALCDHMVQNPEIVFQGQTQLLDQFYTLFNQTICATATGQPNSLVDSATKDKRFQHPDWNSNPYFYFFKESYLLGERWLSTWIQDLPEKDPITLRKFSFLTRQILEACSPSNFAFTNPQVFEKSIETGGQNFFDGAQNFLDDCARCAEELNISMSHPQAFRLGVDLAATPGDVIFQNDLFQLIQYRPQTSQVWRYPLVIVPPFINKFYIFDLRPENSFVRWAVAQGHTVFMISWVNPGPQLREKTFTDYMESGVIQAITIVTSVIQEQRVNLLGFCNGGNLAACTAAYLNQVGKKCLASVTYLATLVDFFNAGDLSIFIDDDQLQALEEDIFQRGYLPGRSLASIFNLLRSKDLIWSFFVNNYLLGNSPPAFDFLYWNSDVTNILPQVHSYYLRHMFQKNLLAQPGGLTLAGLPLHLEKIKTPSFVLATMDDHIAPWMNCYPATQLYRGPLEFVLATSGHVAGVINPPGSGKYAYFTGGEKGFPHNPLDWFQRATQNSGSWWTYWSQWVEKFSTKMVPARIPGTHQAFPILEEAPGSYVQVRV